MEALYHKRAALYIRVSTDEQARHGFSLGEQRIDLEAYAKGKGYEIAGIYADEGASARKAISRRHELQRLLMDVEAGRIDIIVMKCLDRWMRSVRDFYKVQDILDAHNVALEFSQEQDYNTNTTQGRLMLNLKLSIAQHESDTTGERIKYVFAGMKRDKKIISGKMPFGYRIGEGKKIVIEPQEAEVVRFMFSEVTSGRSAYSLLTSVYENYGVSLKYARLLWMLRNKAYTGEFWGMEGFANPIVSKEEYEQAQKALARNPRKATKGSPRLFAGMIPCPSCGRPLAGKTCAKRKKTSIVYECANHYHATALKGKGGDRCPSAKAITESRIEEYLLQNVARLFAENIREMKAKDRRKENASETLAKVSKSLERLNEIYVLGNIDKEAYKARYEALKKQERSLLVDIAPHLTEVPEILRGDGLREKYDGWTKEERRAFWQRLIKRIEIPEGKRAHYIPLNLRVYFF